MMGTRGPIGKRSDAKAGHRTKAELAEVERVDIVEGADVVIPDPLPYWHPIATHWYKSLTESAQGRFMEASDWAAAQYVAEAMTRNLEAERFSANMFAGIWSAMNDLLTTEGARRRAKIEINRASSRDVSAVDSSVSVMDDYRKSIAG